MQPRANLDLSNPNALISRPFDALVHEHFRVSQVIQLRLLGNLIVRRQAKHVAVRTCRIFRRFYVNYKRGQRQSLHRAAPECFPPVRRTPLQILF